MKEKGPDSAEALVNYLLGVQLFYPKTYKEFLMGGGQRPLE